MSRGVMVPCCALLLIAGTLALPSASAADDAPATYARSRAPKIKAGAVNDSDHDGRLDGVVLTYDQKIRHKTDTDGEYPFKVTGYVVSLVGPGKGKSLTLTLVESGAPDTAATPTITYTKTRSKPVTNKRGKPARSQTFSGTTTPDPDGDSFTAADGDCDQADASVHPGATDMPDPAFVDSNCDGIDGEEANAAFVATTGSGSACTLASPCATISQGITTADNGGRRDVYVASGTYGEVLLLADGVNVFGGFGTGFERSALTAGTVTVNGVQQVASIGDHSATVVADALTQPTILAYLTLVGPDMTQTTNPQPASHVIVVRNSGTNLTVTGNSVEGGSGADAVDGAPGNDASAVVAQAAMEGGAGGAGSEINTACNSSSHGTPGLAGTNSSITPGSNMNGGAGGAGGEMDTDCGVFSLNLDAKPGDAGLDAGVTSGAFGKGGLGGTGKDSCGPTTDGNPGRVINGAAGTSGSGGLLDGAGFLVQSSGGGGGIGAHGGGGGGGGGAGGCDAGTDAYGPGGGGGGAGGARAISGGGGGGPGGSSVGIFIINSSPTITDNVIDLGVGGVGGAGGIGGQGQSGGQGGLGGSPHPGTAAAGAGGDGGHGGHGGGGGGGQGGDVWGILSSSGVSLPALSGNTYLVGSGGTGGDGGISAPSALGGDDDGNDGADGADGTANNVGTCASSSDC